MLVLNQPVKHESFNVLSSHIGLSVLLLIVQVELVRVGYASPKASKLKKNGRG